LYSTDSVMVASRSTDGGQTWKEEGRIHDPAGDGRAYSYHGPVMTRLPDGSLILNAIRWDRSDPDKPLFNDETAGALPADTLLYRSTDNGVSWSEPQVVQPPDGMVLTLSCAIVVLKDGHWMLPMAMSGPLLRRPTSRGKPIGQSTWATARWR
jgi:hypothetical protein